MNTITTSLGSCPKNKFSWLLTRLPACYVECFHDLLVNQVLSTGPCIKAQPVPKALCAIHTLLTNSITWAISGLQAPVARELIKQMLSLLCISLISTSALFNKIVS